MRISQLFQLFYYGLILTYVINPPKIYGQNDDLILLEKQAEKYIKSGNTKDACATLLSISTNYYSDGDRKKSLESAHKALETARKSNHQPTLIQTLEHIGNIYHNLGGYQKAFHYLEESFKYQKHQLSKTSKISQLLRLGDLAVYNKSEKNATKYYESAYREARQTKNNGIIFTVTEKLANTYKKLNDRPKYLEYQNRKADVEKKIQREQRDEIVKNAEQMEVDYRKELSDRERKVRLAEQKMIDAQMREQEAVSTSREKDIEINRKDQKEKILSKSLKTEVQKSNKATETAEQERSEKNKLVIFTILMVIFLGIAFWYMHKFRTQERKTRLLNQDLATERQHIADSISYAKRIQEAVLTPKESIHKLFPENFIFFKPKDNVSGDFYWANEKNGMKFMIVADCTGHGVPGAFMSMLGISLINNIILHQGITKPNLILDELSRGIITTLRQNKDTLGNQTNSKDGMDMSLCALDERNNELFFSGAFNPLLLVRNKKRGNNAIVNDRSLNPEKISSQDYHIYVLKADKQPVGIHHRPLRPFTLKTLKLIPEDSIYMSSDGYADQFGGAENRKYMSKNLKKLLLKIQSMGMTGQYTTLKDELTLWQGDHEQIDDICIAGFRY